MANSQASGARFIEILSILKKHKIQKGMDPVKFREILEDLGPTFVKIGQIMSTRQDMFSQRYTVELEKLRSSVKPMPFEEVESVLVQAFGDNWRSIFVNFDTTPLGSASIAQVHRATLNTGQEVVVKVQRPNIYETMKRDIRLVRKAAKFLNLSDIISSVVDLDMVLDEFWATSQEEMDFTIEARFAKRFKETYKDDKTVDAPLIYDEYTSKYVLVMEYVDGLDVNQLDLLESHGYDPSKIAHDLACNYISQIIENGFFHADPHSGNIRVRDDKIVWIDFGMMGTLNVHEREIMKKAVRGIALRDTMTVVDSILALGKPKQEIDYTKFTGEMEQFMATYLDMPFGEIDVAQMLQNVFSICHAYRIQLPKGVSMLARSLTVMEATLLHLDPSTNILEIATSHKATMEQLHLHTQVKKVIRRSFESYNRILDVPVQTSDLLKLVQRGQVKMNLNLMGSDQPIAKLDRMVNRMIICILISAILLGSSLLCLTNMSPKILGIPAIGFVGFMLALLMGLWLFIKMLVLHRHNKMF